MNDSIKIFLAYHKSSPCYKSDIFQPIHVGSALHDYNIEFALDDNSGESISEMNPYFCELTGHYWVLKNYLPTSQDKYIGFAHYRRLPDLVSISESDSPSIYGVGYADSIKLFNDINTNFSVESIQKYDIICPCTCYMYKNTVNPELRDSEPNYSVYDHFRAEHNNNLADSLKTVLDKFYPEYSNALEQCYRSEKSFFYNTFIMKKDVLKSYLEWEFGVLDKLGIAIGGWKQEKYLRMAGFIAETLFSIWIKKHESMSIAYCPVYMVNFESDYIERINQLHINKRYGEEIEVLKEYLPVASDKKQIIFAMMECAFELNDEVLIKSLSDMAENYIETPDDYFQTAVLFSKYQPQSPKVTQYYLKSLDNYESAKLYAQSFLSYAESTHNIENIKLAWEKLDRFELTEAEKQNKKRFLMIYEQYSN